MKVAVVGSGGREHALAWKLAHSPLVAGIWCAPGNAGTARLGTNVPVAAGDIPALVELVRREGIDLVVVGPEEPLVKGLVDALGETAAVFGPSRQAARLEGSKVFAKEFMRRWGIPTAGFAVFSEPGAARDYIRRQDRPLVVKADGLAAGKGAFVCDSPAQAEQVVEDLLERHTLGTAGQRVVIEERLQGEELSVLAVCDGHRHLVLLPARDHKRAFDGDRGPNTGGMGAYAPAPLPPGLLEAISRKVLEPTLAGLAEQGVPYRGVLYAGLMLTETGPQVLEFNCRFGDPETQAVLPLLEDDLAAVLAAAARGDLASLGREELRWRSGYAVSVVVASGGYPGPYRKGLPISGLAEAEAVPGVAAVFHAGTAPAPEGGVVTAGGRVLGVTALGPTLSDAAAAAYAACEKIHFSDLHYRRDIGRPASGAGRGGSHG